jgi:hypothetical protein
MKIVLTREFSRLALKLGLGWDKLRDAVRRADSGLIDADLGAHLIKQRIARAGAGQSGGYRAILFYRKADRAVFLHVFEKSNKANLTKSELAAYRDFATALAQLDGNSFKALVATQGWKEIEDDKT